MKIRHTPRHLRSLRQLAAIGLLLSCPWGAHGQQTELTAPAEPDIEREEGVYYRWFDQAGQPHYTDFEPDGVPSERIELRPGTDQTTPTLEADAPELEWSDPSLDAARSTAPDSASTSAPVTPLTQAGPCADARRQLEVLHSDLPVYKGADGALLFSRSTGRPPGSTALSAEERLSALQWARNRVLDKCGDPAAVQAELDAQRRADAGS